jgi:hypothetical protein
MDVAVTWVSDYELVKLLGVDYRSEGRRMWSEARYERAGFPTSDASRSPPEHGNNSARNKL